MPPYIRWSNLCFSLCLRYGDAAHIAIGGMATAKWSNVLQTGFRIGVAAFVLPHYCACKGFEVRPRAQPQLNSTRFCLLWAVVIATSCPPPLSDV
ncbi:MAG: hypothetical protein IPL33_09840 [Sphingobacteriales bacterium]|nr:hypothetical protein [Sphingobacteriales bacterium]MCC7224024.1 hypothetical protein [Chitinophagales bacterium]